MAKGPSKEQLHDIIMEATQPVAASFGLEVWGIELGGAGRPMIRIFVDTPVGSPPVETGEDGDVSQSGVNIGQCAEISRLVGLALEVEEVFPDAWVLEVSSPGLERAFFRAEQLSAYVGREMDVTLWEPHPDFDTRRKFHGILDKVTGDVFSLRLDETDAAGEALVVDISWEDVRKARLIHHFPDTSKPVAGKEAGPKEPKPKKAAKGGGKQA